MRFAGESIVFRDSNHLFGSGASLSSLAKIAGLEMEKSCFPFSFLDSAEKLNLPYMPADQVPNLAKVNALRASSF